MSSPSYLVAEATDMVAACRGLVAIPATVMEIDEAGPRVLVALSDDDENIIAFMVLDTEAARIAAKMIMDAADAADQGEGRILPPSLKGGRA